MSNSHRRDAENAERIQISPPLSLVFGLAFYISFWVLALCLLPYVGVFSLPFAFCPLPFLSASTLKTKREGYWAE